MDYPKHIAIIPDGNRTRAKENHKLPFQGHRAGYVNTLDLIEYIFSQTPIQAVTFRGLSTENLKQRSKEELDYIYEFAKQLKKDLGKILKAHKINFKWAGSIIGLPRDLITTLQEMQSMFSFPTNKYVVMAINYGGRDEIIRGIKKRSTEDGDLAALNEEHFSQFLDFGNVSPVDLVIRTKGEIASRLSGFMLRWVGYAELFFSKLHFPDFGTKELKEALDRFQERVNMRNFGK